MAETSYSLLLVLSTSLEMSQFGQENVSYSQWTIKEPPSVVWSHHSK
jgi:hypothetical protein